MSVSTSHDTLGLYLSVPFCRAKCTFCNFASDVFPSYSMDRYVTTLCDEIRSARTVTAALGAHLPRTVDTVYFGGGTPSLLSADHLRALFTHLRQAFHLAPAAEITLEAAPGQLTDATLDELLHQGVNRISFGIQSFIDRETSAIGRLHTRDACLAEIRRLQSRGLPNLSLDLIAGLPCQTEATWRQSLAIAIATGAPHVSIYMLEIDDSSRLGHELLTGGSRYHAPSVPTDDQSAAFYEIACDTLDAAGLAQYEISNFARSGHHSRHNLKYWHRDPYLGFGLDAHSMLSTAAGAIRFANTADMDLYLRADPTASETLFPRLTSRTEASSSETPSSETPSREAPSRETRSREEIQTIDPAAALEESLFLGLRLNAGISLGQLRSDFGDATLRRLYHAVTETVASGLLEQAGDRLRLTSRGRMLSNEVFSRLLLSDAA